MADERLDAAEAGGVDRDAHAVEEPLAVLAPARELDGEHAAGHPVAQDPARELVLRMRREARDSGRAATPGRALERRAPRPAHSTSGAPCAARASSGRAAPGRPPTATRCRRR